MTKLSLLLTCLAISGHLFAQIEVSSTGNVGIGATPTQTQKLCVEGTTYLNGNVGIGTTNPSKKLHVVGDSYLTGNLGIGVASSSYKMDVNGSVRFTTSNTFLAKPTMGTSLIYGDYCYIISNGNLEFKVCNATLYPYTNNTVQLGLSDKRFNRLNVYTIDYHTLISSSDKRIKENIVPCPPLLKKLKELQAYNYNYTDEYFKDFTKEEKAVMQRKEYGFIAQEMEKIFPELVWVTDSTGMLAINYVSMVPILASALNELHQVVETQAKEIEYLKKELMTHTVGKNEDQDNSVVNFTLGVDEKTGSEDMMLYQNAPNPFNSTTTIHCYIPQSVNKSQLCIYNMHGEQVKCLTISKRGRVEVQIEAEALLSGIYTYLLIGDGKTSEAKNMILTK